MAFCISARIVVEILWRVCDRSFSLIGCRSLRMVCNVANLQVDFTFRGQASISAHECNAPLPDSSPENLVYLIWHDVAPRWYALA